ncbi:hypothetical protein K440DRAFT_642155 [Wilcoxina mikolae CBS 423.85]|nr:hypothetical protein K440DRAFT_642155 [Wilcoxina mikolae CBS 423.85]
MSLNSSPLSAPTGQSSSRNQATDNGTCRQLRTNTFGNDTGPANSRQPLKGTAGQAPSSQQARAILPVLAQQPSSYHVITPWSSPFKTCSLQSTQQMCSQYTHTTPNQKTS